MRIGRVGTRVTEPRLRNLTVRGGTLVGLVLHKERTREWGGQQSWLLLLLFSSY